MYPLQWNWPCIFTATEVVSWITDYQFIMKMHISYMYRTTFTLNQMQGNIVCHLLMDL